MPPSTGFLRGFRSAQVDQLRAAGSTRKVDAACFACSPGYFTSSPGERMPLSSRDGEGEREWEWDRGMSGAPRLASKGPRESPRDSVASREKFSSLMGGIISLIRARTTEKPFWLASCASFKCGCMVGCTHHPKCGYMFR